MTTKRKRLARLAWVLVLTAYTFALLGVWTAPHLNSGNRFGATAFLTLVLAGITALMAIEG